MASRSTTRRHLLRTGAAAGGVALAGCFGPLGGSDGASGALDRVPADARFVLHADVAALLADDVLRSRVETLAADTGRFSGDGSSSVSEALDRVEREVGLDPRAVDGATLFAGYEPGAPAGALVSTGWTESDLRGAFEEADADADRIEYGGHTVYALDDSSVGVLGDGEYVFGQRVGVEAAVDVATGDAEPVGGRVREGFRSAADGAVRLAFDLPDSLAEDVGDGAAVDREVVEALTHGYGAYVADGDDRVAQLTIETERGDAAEQLAGLFRTGLTVARARADDEDRAIAPQAGAMLDSIEIDRRDTAVVIRVGRGADALVLGLAALVVPFVLGLGDSRTAPVAPNAAFEFDYDADAGTVEVTHVGGDSIPADELFVRGTGFADAPEADLAAPGRWQGSASGELEGRPTVVAGDGVTVGVAGDDYVLRVIWEAADGDASAELAVDRGPEA